jgi:methylated-DNA-[protein]-cysteine S-methyltransferase
MVKDPPVVGTWVVRSPLASLLVRASSRGVTEIRFASESVVDCEERRQPDRDALPWMPDLLDTLEAYLAGEIVSFEQFPVDLRGQPEFRRRVQEACRKIPYGRTLTYAKLAAKVGHPGAGRAVGSAMSHNPAAILIPCHRVLRSDGSLGGYSAPGGTSLKQKLLDMEERNSLLA